jgi:cytochrome c peroxidase
MKVDLGKRLFFERSLSKDSSISCASCHQPTFAFAEPRRVSVGIGEEARRRNTISVVNTIGSLHLTWDGSSATLEDQIRNVFSESGDMGVSLPEVIRRLRASGDYSRLFETIYERAPDVTALGDALASFQRSLVFVDSRFDRYLFDGDTNALNAAEVRGWKLFTGTRTNCAGCHTPALSGGRDVRAAFRDHRFHNIGVGYANGEMQDLGRYEHTSSPPDWGAFLTPSLRNVGLTSPYMHDGSIRTLEEVVDFYVRGGNPNPNLDVTITPLRLTAVEQADLVAFLRSLTSETLLTAFERNRD